MFHPDGPTWLELARQALSSTERGYDLLAPKFDLTPFRTPDELLASVRPRIGAPASIGSALDLCCGTGAAMRMLRPLCRDRVVGIDVSGGMLTVCRKRVAGAPGHAALHLVRGDVLAMPFAPLFDLAVCFGALGHILRRDQPRFVDQIARALKPGGRFVFLSADVPPIASRAYWFSRLFNAAMHMRNALIQPPFIMYYLRFLLPEARRLLEDRGFAVEISEEMFGGPSSAYRLVVATLRPEGPRRRVRSRFAAKTPTLQKIQNGAVTAD